MDVSFFLSRISFNLAYVMKSDLIIQVHLRKFEDGEKVIFFLVTFQKVKLSYI